MKEIISVLQKNILMPTCLTNHQTYNIKVITKSLDSNDSWGKKSHIKIVFKIWTIFQFYNRTKLSHFKVKKHAFSHGNIPEFYLASRK